ncbi:MULTISPECIES: sensor histidine kinase [Bacillota]|uniref:histidine kinase n=2 Tax=Amedibacillus TaxID=2749846 RepID=A0A7G9GM47_9FIRM|nr:MULTISPECIES: histidine kinase [Bacillota]QNM11879.1 two-component sensor histidine kinase [[Eubacterium] hominis]MCH4287198.1 histidine kinase [Amedibacillus hominis]RGB50613.1 two-component sensor histidine kinase [Absiella sp. AM22-9]RGB62890.1 two-component sensor histidine kinase [Absiella sp. AM10-20]RGB64815.1 two-component sensor histidine kinase [Absiella sp. AM09-45]
MNEIINLIILFFYGFIFMYMDNLQLYSILPLLCAIILCSIGLLYPKYKKLLLLYLIISFIFPDFIYFVPCTFYLWIKDRKLHPDEILFLIPYLISYSKIHHIFLLACALCLSYILKVRYIENEELKKSYLKQRDATKELANLIEEKNKNLLLAQEQDIHIAILNERNRIAREIHDHVGHLLSSSLLQIGALQAINQQDNMKAPLQDLRSTISQGMDNVRNSVHDLHDDALDLHIVLQKLCEEYTFCKIQLEYDIVHPFGNTMYYHILAIIKEALHNITRHSNANMVSLTLREQPAFYQLIIHDNGTDIYIKKEGIGLQNMKDRVDQMHGFFNILTDDGFQIFITIPKEDKTV